MALSIGPPHPRTLAKFLLHSLEDTITFVEKHDPVVIGTISCILVPCSCSCIVCAQLRRKEVEKGKIPILLVIEWFALLESAHARVNAASAEQIHRWGRREEKDGGGHVQ